MKLLGKCPFEFSWKMLLFALSITLTFWKLAEDFTSFWGNQTPLWVLENQSGKLFYWVCRQLLLFPWDSPGRNCPRCHVWGGSEERVMGMRRQMVTCQQPFKQERLCCLKLSVWYSFSLLFQTKSLSQFVRCTTTGIVARESSANGKPIIRLRKARF